jgi:hypothetical protein
MHLRAPIGDEVLEQITRGVVVRELLKVLLDDVLEVATPVDHSQVEKCDAKMLRIVSGCITIRDINATNHLTGKFCRSDGVDVLVINITVFREFVVVDTVNLGLQELHNVRVCLDKMADRHSEAEPDDVKLQLDWRHTCIDCVCDCICLEEKTHNIGHLVHESPESNQSRHGVEQVLEPMTKGITVNVSSVNRVLCCVEFHACLRKREVESLGLDVENNYILIIFINHFLLFFYYFIPFFAIKI